MQATTTPRVLAVLVAHDGEPWLARCLAALDAQTYPELDVVAIDNGSTDGSRRLLIDHLGEDRVLVAERDLSTSGVEVSFFGEATKMPAGPAMLAVQTGALLLPVTLWYDDSPVMRGRLHPPIEVPESGTRAEKAAAMCQELADVFAAGIAEHPEDWHMLQRLWLADLEPRPSRTENA